MLGLGTRRSRRRPLVSERRFRRGQGDAVIRSAKIIFCDNEHGFGDVTFPSLDRPVDELQGEYVAPQRVSQLRKDAKKAGWGRVQGGDYCPQCMESME